MFVFDHVILQNGNNFFFVVAPFFRASSSHPPAPAPFREFFYCLSSRWSRSPQSSSSVFTYCVRACVRVGCREESGELLIAVVGIVKGAFVKKKPTTRNLLPRRREYAKKKKKVV